MGTLRATIVDDLTHRPIEARVHALSSTGQFRAPPDAILKVGGGPPFFYADGAFTLDLPIGDVQLILERGTEYLPLTRTLAIPRTGTVDVELRLRRWIDLRADGWHAGNTHIHYNEHETRPDERLRLDPHVEDLSVAAISVLKRRELAYASNKYRVGFAHHLSSDTLSVDVGEETRHNDGPWGRGYGHVMLLGLQRLVEPVSRGALVDDFSPDYPPLIDACDEARSQGGVAIWCHNGNGMEAPVAASLGKLDAFNLFDPYWMDPEWDIWYALLNCGFVLPASTGSDWFICSSNRVYVQTGASDEPAALDHGTPDHHPLALRPRYQPRRVDPQRRDRRPPALPPRQYRRHPRGHSRSLLLRRPLLARCPRLRRSPHQLRPLPLGPHQPRLSPVPHHLVPRPHRHPHPHRRHPLRRGPHPLPQMDRDPRQAQHARPAHAHD